MALWRAISGGDMFTEPQDTETINTQVIFALTLLGEFESGGVQGMREIASVVMNRVNANQWWGKGIRQVCLWPWQFSCWNAGPDRNRMMAIMRSPDIDPNFKTALQIAESATDDSWLDCTAGATHYFNHKILPERLWPQWYLDLDDQTPCLIHEPHWFFDLSATG